MLPGCTRALFSDQWKRLSSPCSWSNIPHTTVSAPATSQAGDKHESPSPTVCWSNVRGEGPQRDASASPALWAPFPVLCMYVIHVQQQGGAVTPGPQEHCSPDTNLHWDPTSCSSFLRGNHPCGAWAGPLLCQHCHLGPYQDLTAPSASTCLSPQWRTGGRWAQCPRMWPQSRPGKHHPRWGLWVP